MWQFSEKKYWVLISQNGHAGFPLMAIFHRENIDVYRKEAIKFHHSYTAPQDYLHLNWGWNGNSNGYYLAEYFVMEVKDLLFASTRQPAG